MFRSRPTSVYNKCRTKCFRPTVGTAHRILRLNSPKIKRYNMEFIFSFPMRVRDYECDIQGIVNNANYLHYFEVCRHEYIESRGVEFADLHRRGIDVVVAQAEI